MAGSPYPCTIYSDINHRRTLLLSNGKPTPRSDHFYNTDNLRAVAPRGFPAVAAMQMQWPNTGTFRTFDYLNWRRLKFYETKLTYLESQLHRLDVLEERTIDGSQKSKLPFNKESFIDCRLRGSDDASYIPEALAADGQMSQDEFTDLREKLYTHIECISPKYHELVGSMQRTSTLPRVPREAHYQLFTAARELHGLGGEAIEHLRAVDDMAYVSLNPVDSRFQSFWLSATPWVRRILIFLCLRNDPLPDNGGSQTYNAVEVNLFKFSYSGLKALSTTLLGSSLILIPVGILYLAGLNKPLSFAVVVIFGVVFNIALILIEHRIGHAVVGGVAYVAVLVTFLANVT